ncbi:phosphate-binding periplasmic protein [Gloeomargarita lithophora Alchichica-D10]|uniref:Phosphate-binding protein n=1 Tax=Gloeomargarita lithophora Alchichica-D10 TaxID=1188229 RepID=A0A1J0AFI1_9CYAN|nr:phosphate ABC transporter substrate-binding protein PstS [Gloeomargarita lithophora]APB34672.1 phosphate-binding periplasmic protein [Gloeomargarita lithophora Alchichica-D10]
MLKRFGLARRWMSFVTLFLLVTGLTAACDFGGQQAVDSKLPITGEVSLIGLGASFPAPLYQNWAVGLNQVHSNIRVDYQSQGSGAGIENFIQGNVDFAASDVAMKDEDITKVERGVLLLPMTAGSIVLAYNLPGVPTGLKLSRELYVGILSGQIRRWNDPKIVALNPGVTLPDQAITVVHRSDGSGTTGVFTKHLSAISPVWKQKFGDGTTIQWPTTGNFVGARGNEGVTAQIQQTPGAVGYIEFGFARTNNMTVAALENKAGDYVIPTPESGAATLAAVELPANLRAFISDPEGKESYPIVTYTWQMQYQKQPDANKGVALEVWVEYGLNEGQTVAPGLGYIPLPKVVRERIAKAADTISDKYTITLKD